MSANTEFNIGPGFAWAYPRGVDSDFEKLFRVMGNITLAQLIELVQKVEDTWSNNESGRTFQQRFEMLKALPTPVIRRILLHPAWIYWVRSTRQIIQAKNHDKEIPQQWRRHLQPVENSHAGLLQESLELFGHLVLAAHVLAQQEIELALNIGEDRFLCLPGTGLALQIQNMSVSDRRSHLVSATVKEVRKDEFHLLITSLDDSKFHIDLRTDKRVPTAAAHWLKEINLGDHRCEIDNKDSRLIKNWVWFDVFPGKPVVHVASDSQVARWQQKLGSAYETLQRFCPLIAQELAYIWRTVIPVRVEKSRQSVSCSSRDFWGAIQVSSHPGIALSEVLAHEYRHNILNALLEVDTIIEDSCTDQPIFYSPWRSDSRPLWGLLHGIYSFLEVVDFNLNYLEKTDRSPSQADFAEKRVIINLCRLKLALDELERNARFTRFGQDFFHGLVTRFQQFEAVTSELDPRFRSDQIRKTGLQYSKWQQTT